MSVAVEPLKVCGGGGAFVSHCPHPQIQRELREAELTSLLPTEGLFLLPQTMLDEDDVKVAADALKELEALMPGTGRQAQHRHSEHQ